MASLVATLREHYAVEVVEALNRLVTFRDMQPVWAGLSDSEDEALPEHFLDACAVSLSQWTRISKMPSKELENTLAKLADLAETLAHKLREYSPEVDFQGTPRAVHALMPATASDFGSSSVQRATASNGGQSNGEGTALSEAEQFDDDTTAAEWVFVDELLIELAARLRRPPTSELAEIRPTKVNEPSAQRTFLARSLTYFLLTHGGAARPTWVANAVSALLDLADPIEPDLVSKLTKDLRQADWRQADDFRAADLEY